MLQYRARIIVGEVKWNRNKHSDPKKKLEGVSKNIWRRSQGGNEYLADQRRKELRRKDDMGDSSPWKLSLLKRRQAG